MKNDSYEQILWDLMRAGLEECFTEEILSPCVYFDETCSTCEHFKTEGDCGTLAWRDLQQRIKQIKCETDIREARLALWALYKDRGYSVRGNQAICGHQVDMTAESEDTIIFVVVGKGINEAIEETFDCFSEKYSFIYPETKGKRKLFEVVDLEKKADGHYSAMVRGYEEKECFNGAN